MCIQEKLIDWAKETVNIYNSITETLNKKDPDKKWGYYTQTPLSLVSQSPDLLILGINPGAEGGKDNMTVEEFLKGNPCFEGLNKEGIVNAMSKDWDKNKKRNGWALWHRLNNMLEKSSNHQDLLQNFNRFVLSNMIFFGTANEKQIPKIDKEKCAERTIKLIEKLEPKVVILLGKQCRDLFNRLNKNGKLEVLVPNSIYHSMYGKSHVLAIKHTAYYYSSEEMAVVGKTIGYILDHHDETIDKETINASYIKEDIAHFEERLKMTQSKRKGKTDDGKSEKLVIKERTKLLKVMVSKNGAIQKIYSGTVLFHEYFTTVVNGEYVDSKDKIAIDLMPDEERKLYSVLVFTRQYDETKTKDLINGIWPSEEYHPWYKDVSRHVHDVISFEVSNEEIKNKIEKVLQEVKAYRDKKYPLNR